MRVGFYMGFAGLALAGCTSRPAPPKATELLEARFRAVEAATCRWQAPVAQGDGWTFIDDGFARGCADDLEKAGLVERGDCPTHVTPEGTCAVRGVRAKGAARFEGGALTFSCGSLQLVAIEGVAAREDGVVVVTYTRDFVPAPLLATLGRCTSPDSGPAVLHPEPARATRTAALVPMPDGTWKLANETPDMVHTF